MIGYKNQITLDINNYVLFLPLSFLFSLSPLSESIWCEVLKLWKSMMPILGLSLQPKMMSTLERSLSRSSSMISSFIHLLNALPNNQVLENHSPLSPVLRKLRIAFVMPQRECFRFLSCRLMTFSKTCHCRLSIRLIGYSSIILIDWHSWICKIQFYCSTDNQ